MQLEPLRCCFKANVKCVVPTVRDALQASVLIVVNDILEELLIVVHLIETAPAPGAFLLAANSSVHSF